MNKFIFLSTICVILLTGCSQDTVMATSVVELAGNKKVIGWGDEEDIPPKPIKKCGCIKQKIKYNGTFKGKIINRKL